MQRTHTLAQQAPLEMPEGFDPSGVPSGESTRRRRSGGGRRRHDHALPGLAPATILASVEGVAVRGEADWLVWGCAAGTPVLFRVEAGAAAEMLAAVARGEPATAIVEPSQLLLERLD